MISHMCVCRMRIQICDSRESKKEIKKKKKQNTQKRTTKEKNTLMNGRQHYKIDNKTPCEYKLIDQIAERSKPV